MLKKIDPSNSVPVAYLKQINPSVITSVLLSQEDTGPSKKSQKTKKEVKEGVDKKSPKKGKSKSLKKTADKETGSKKGEKSVENVVAESSKELISSKSGVFKRLKKMSHKSQTSLEDQSQLIRKAQLNRNGVKVCEIPDPVSPSSKKRRVEDVAKHISKKIKKRKLFLQNESSEDNE
ncbi:unnamed protein product [Lactuca virosa]|uniref:Uncharacterized protein n=1 Tax=Lactuca virosa TaxID=75947 RepID=A0AAU9LG76_9ASTR|nr:unnamed protein product [Lactuca virosa]